MDSCESWEECRCVMKGTSLCYKGRSRCSWFISIQERLEDLLSSIEKNYRENTHDKIQTKKL